MAYTPRHAQDKFLRMSSFFKVVLITGARQVGKTTMLKELAQGTDRTYVSLDDHQARLLAKTDPNAFFQLYPLPIIIDEVQYAPELFSQIKLLVDNTDETGAIWLTGSQSYAMMKGVNESLAGRIGIMEMFSMTHSEKHQLPFTFFEDFSLESLLEREKHRVVMDMPQVYAHILEGGMPQVQEAPADLHQNYFSSYVNSYIMRDVLELGGISDSVRFFKFLTACAALTSQQVNYATLAESADIAQTTAKTWLNLLVGLGVVYLLQPYATNTLKRISKTPKLYFCDTGLAAYLSHWKTVDQLMTGAVSGAFFENAVIIDIMKNQSYGATTLELSYYRDSNGKEIDLILDRADVAYPFEIKRSANPDNREIKKFEVLATATKKQGYGGIICLCQQVYPIPNSTAAKIPYGLF